MPALAPLASVVLVEKIANAVVRDWRESDGSGVAGLLDGATITRNGEEHSVAPQVVAYRRVVSGAVRGLGIGVEAVRDRNLPATKALASRAGGTALCDMANAAVESGWAEGMRAVIAGDPEGHQTRLWFPGALPGAMASRELLEAVLSASGIKGEAWDSYGAVVSREIAVDTVIALATSEDPWALWQIVQERCPVLAGDLAKVAESGTTQERNTFFTRLASRALANGSLTPRGLDFLAWRICRSRDCVGRLARAWVTGGAWHNDGGRAPEANAQAWAACCRGCPHVAAGFAAEAGTARYVRRMVETLDGMNGGRGAMAWVRVLAPLGARTPMARAGQGLSESAGRLYEAWVAVRGEAKFAAEDGDHDAPVRRIRRRA